MIHEEDPMLRRVMAVATAVVGGALLAGPASAASTVALQGTLAGSYSAMQTNPDTGHGYRVNGSGHTSLGATTGKGTVRGPGNIANGHCGATLTLTTSKGSVTVSAVGTKSVKGFADCQSGFAFKWHMTKGTGSYAGKSGSGTGTLTLVKQGNASQNPPPAYVTFDPEH
jgi:hypothetical protein